MMRFYQFTFGILCLFVGAAAACADTVVLRDGDALSGTLVGISSGTVELHNSFVGRILLPLDEVETTTTESPMQFFLANGAVCQGRLAVVNGVQQVRPSTSDEPLPIDLAEVVRTAPVVELPAKKADSAKAESPAVHGDVEMGVRWRSGTTDYAAPFTRLRLFGAGEEHSFSSVLSWDYAVKRDTLRYFDVAARLEGKPSDRAHPLLTLDLERNTDRALDLRSDLSLGVGRTFLEGESQQLDASVGLGATFEYYDLEPLRGEGRFARAYSILGARSWRALSEVSGTDIQRDNQELNLRVEMRYRQDLFLNGALTEDLVLYSSLTELGDLRARSSSAVQFPLWSRIKLRLDVAVDYDNEPEYLRVDEWQTSVGASLLWDF